MSVNDTPSGIVTHSEKFSYLECKRLDVDELRTNTLVGAPQTPWEMGVGGPMRQNPAFPTASTMNDFVFPTLTTEAAGNKVLFDSVKGAVRAGVQSGTTWDDANRGIGSTAFGRDTFADGDYSTVAGGYGNVADREGAFVGGGGSNGGASLPNVATSISGAICGGLQNVMTGNTSFIGGGQDNQVGGNLCAVGGGHFHRLDGSLCGIWSGNSNEIRSSFTSGSCISGGDTNLIGHLGAGNVGWNWHYIGGGMGNQIATTPLFQTFASSIVGGEVNNNQSSRSVIAGGHHNSIVYGADQAGILCGNNNTIAGTALGSSIIAGTFQTALLPNRGYAQEFQTDLLAVRATGASTTRIGSVVLVAGTATVLNATAAVGATDHIMLTNLVVGGGGPGALFVSARVNGVSFTITSTNGADNSTVGYIIVSQAV